MKKYKFIPLLLAAALTFTAAVGCSDENSSSSGGSEFISHDSDAVVATDGKLEGIAENEVSAAPEEGADENDTVFTLNRIVDSGNVDENGRHFIYLDVTIQNNAAKEYEMSALNNFYLLMNDGSEVHFDIRTQLYGVKSVENYSGNPFTIPNKGTFSGIIGGFLVDDGVKDFTVCFFPTLDVGSDKSTVVKVPVTEANFK